MLSDALQARHLKTKSHRDLDEAIARLETTLTLPDLHSQHRSTWGEKLKVAEELHDARTGTGSADVSSKSTKGVPLCG